MAKYSNLLRGYDSHQITHVSQQTHVLYTEK